MSASGEVVESPEALMALAKKLAEDIQADLKISQTAILIYLQGDLGAGKTTFTKGFLKAFGYEGLVKSPTYTLVEPYEIDSVKLYHFDLYRLNYPTEAEEMGVMDYFHPNSVSIIEWPEKAEGVLPKANWQIFIAFQENNSHRLVNIKNLKQND